MAPTMVHMPADLRWVVWRENKSHDEAIQLMAKSKRRILLNPEGPLAFWRTRRAPGAPLLSLACKVCEQNIRLTRSVSKKRSDGKNLRFYSYYDPPYSPGPAGSPKLRPAERAVWIPEQGLHIELRDPLPTEVPGEEVLVKFFIKNGKKMK